MRYCNYIVCPFQYTCIRLKCLARARACMCVTRLPEKNIHDVLHKHRLRRFRLTYLFKKTTLYELWFYDEQSFFLFFLIHDVCKYEHVRKTSRQNRSTVEKENALYAVFLCRGVPDDPKGEKSFNFSLRGP